MQTITIKSLTPETEEICAIRLVGGFDSKHRHYPALDLSHFDNKKIFEKTEDYYDAEHSVAIRALEKRVITDLVMAEDLIFDDVRYVFDLKSFTEPGSLKAVALDVLAQIIEE